MKTMNLQPEAAEATVSQSADDSEHVRVGAVAYLNSKPLIEGLPQVLSGTGQFTLSLPSQLADQLAAADIDIGLIPVFEYFQHPEFQAISNAVIACKGPVWSVRVFFRRDPKNVQTIAMDEGSRTSVALTKVLYQNRFGFIPKSIPLPIEEDPRNSKADAVLVIGDRAMHPESYRPGFIEDWDLGNAWFEDTGLPFVFACWVCRNKSFVTDSMRASLEAARDQGVRQIAKIADACSSNYRLTQSQCVDYLTNYIRFYLNAEERVGLEEFRRRCQLVGLVSASAQHSV